MTEIETLLLESLKKLSAEFAQREKCLIEQLAELERQVQNCTKALQLLNLNTLDLNNRLQAQELQLLELLSSELEK